MNWRFSLKKTKHLTITYVQHVQTDKWYNEIITYVFVSLQTWTVGLMHNSWPQTHNQMPVSLA